MRYFYQSKTGSFLLSVLFVFIIAFSACAVRTPVPQIPVSDVSRNLKYKTIIFKKFTAASDVEQPVGPLAECEASSITYLREKNIFEKGNNGALTRSIFITICILCENLGFDVPGNRIYVISCP